MEYYLAIKEEKYSFPTMWMNLMNAFLSEIRQIPKDKYCILSLSAGVQIYIMDGNGYVN